jgi:serine/threonine protein kinase
VSGEQRERNPMTPERWAHVRRVFDGALERPAKDRAAYLRLVCARDDELRREVETLLASHDQSEDFLATPAAHLNQILASDSQIVTHDDERDEFPKGYRVGPYQFERRIGRGGMGAVWLATRHDREYQKQVAIKMVKRGMDSQEILRRFRTERQVLANLDHPNIARLIDGGSTPDGLPYLVMEYVEGTPIDQYCERNKRSITDRLQLFRAVCAAVQFAHQNLVVHRDIKTSNILVTADGTAKLLDFGIAKLLSPPSSTLDLAQTRPGMRPMTVDYASPEQIRGEPITTTTDVYSLGVLLYRLLTGKMPYGTEVRTQAALQHAICEMEPLRPSAVILSDEKSGVPEATQKMDAIDETRAKARQRLRKKLAGDLDNIILMALRKEPHRRYVSAGQFSEDIGRYLNGQPVMARLDTPGYRLTKFVRRNAKGVAAAGVAGAALIAVAALSQRSAHDAVAARAQSERMLVETRHQLISAYLRHGDTGDALEAARAAYAANRGSVLARLDVATAASAAGDQIFSAKADRAAAMAFYREALTQYDAVAQMNTRDIGARRDLMLAARKLGDMEAESGSVTGALADYRRALQSAQILAAAEGAQISQGTRQEVADVTRRISELSQPVGK